MVVMRSSRSSSRPLPALPAGFRFYPTDEELIEHYLMNQVAAVPCPVPIIAEVNIYGCNPWELPAKAVFGEKEWYFFSPRDRKYPNGARPNRAAGSGYWKATGTDKAILSTTPASDDIGVKKALVFYSGKPPRGVKTDWIMHEYRLAAAADKNNNNNTSTKRRPSSSSSSMRLDDWVLCRIYKKSNDFQPSDQEEQQDGSTVEEDYSHINTTKNTNAPAPPNPQPAAAEADDADDHDQFLDKTSMMSKSCSLADLLNTIDYSALSQLLLDGSSFDAAVAAEAPEPQLIYPTPPPASSCQEQELLHYNNNVMTTMNSHVMNTPQVAVDANYSSGAKRKRIMTTMDGASSGSFDDGSNNGFTKKLLFWSSDSRNGGFQYSGLMSAHPFLQDQDLLLMNNHHLQMQ